MRVTLSAAVAAVLILGYGYYHALTHGWLYINLMDTSVKRYALSVRGAELRLLDQEGRLLANARSDDKFGMVRVIHPEAGDCAAVEKSASISRQSRGPWQDCFRIISKWMVRWAEKVRFSDVKFATCSLTGIPVTVRKSMPDWWLWWAPLPHIGGKPVTLYSLSINVDRANCAAAGLSSRKD